MSSGKAEGSAGRKAAARHAAETAGGERVSRRRKLPTESSHEVIPAAPRKVKRAALLVLGMHRGGTSLLAGVLQRLGATSPKTLMQPDVSNPKVYSGSLALMKAHDQILASAGASWSDWTPFNPDWAESPVADQFAEDLWEVFEQEYGNAPLVVMKDPRVCRFAGFWIDLLNSRGVQAMPLIVIRDPLEVAASLDRRDNMPTMAGLLLWLRHMVDAERATRGMSRAFVNHDDILGDWRQSVADIRARLGVRWPRYSPSVELEIDEWVDPSLRSEAASARAALSRQDVVEWVQRFHAALLETAKTGETQAALKVFDAVAAEFDKSSAVFGAFTKSLENAASVAADNARQAKERVATLIADIAAANERGRAADQHIATHGKEIAAIGERAKLAESRAEAASRELVVAGEKLKLAEAKNSAIQAQLSAAIEARSSVDAHAERLSEQLSKVSQELLIARAKTQQAESHGAQMAIELEAAHRRSAASEARIEALINDLSEAAQAVKATGADLRMLAAERDEQRKIAAELAMRLESVEPELQKTSAELKLATEMAKIREIDIARMKEIFETSLESRDRDIARLEQTLLLGQTNLQEVQAQLDAVNDQYAVALAVLVESPDDALSRDALEAALKSAEESRDHAHQVCELLKKQLAELEHAHQQANNRIRSLEAALNASRRNVAPMKEAGRSFADSFSNRQPSTPAALVRALMFDEGYYSGQLQKLGVEVTGDLVEHYLVAGAKLGLNPHPDFDTIWYLRANPDVARQGVNPLVHFLQEGKAEGRNANPKLDLNASTYSVDRPYPFVPARVLNDASEQYVGARRSASARVAVFTAITGGYDEVSMHEHLDPAIDYHLFVDAPSDSRFIYKTHPIPLFDTDPVRAARFVKTHAHMLLPDYDVAIWIDGNVLIRGDLKADIEAFRKSDCAVAAIPHPLRTNVYEEMEECGKRSKDSVEVMQQQVRRYLDDGFDGEGLIESNFMMFRLGHSKLAEFLSIWWAEIENGSRRDQLSLSYALHKSGVTAFPLTERPHSVRNHKALALFHHGSQKRPVDDEAILALSAQPATESYARARERRVAAQRNRRVDVIVCVHNALDVVKVCLESVAHTRRPERHRIVIVNDGSDRETSTWLSQFVSAHSNAKLVHHEKAGGYTKAANAGLRELQGDMAILLNSDTIVAAGWIEKMADAVFSNVGAGIVGPLSNAASTQSLPDHISTATQTAINDLPPNFSVDDMNRWCEENSPADFVPRVPLVHGFCFGLVREVIERIGYFDEQNFPNGYGEENDYCMRAVNAGFSPVIATHTYVYHKKSQSYDGEVRAALVKSGNQMIRDLHGEARVIRAIRAMQENPYLARLRKLSLALFTHPDHP